MYHRISAIPIESDPWGLAVGVSDFASHIEFLSRSGRAGSTLRDFDRSFGSLPAGSEPIFLTFDDGYADNVTLALPILERFGVAATMFISTGAINSTAENWWDELDRIFLCTSDLPRHICMDVRGVTVRADLGASTTGYRPDPLWRASPDTVRDRRQALFLEIWHRLNTATDGARQQVLRSLADWAGITTTPRPEYSMMSSPELATAAGSNLIEIGSHGISHTSLPLLDDATLASETTGSRRHLEQLTAKPVTTFAFPSGRLDHRTLRAVTDAGYERAVTTVGRHVIKSTGLLELPRLQIHNVALPAFKRIVGEK